MNTYTLPGCRRKLRTGATRRFLIVSVYEGRPRVECTTDDEDAAARLIRTYRTEFGPAATLHLLDQTGRGGS